MEGRRSNRGAYRGEIASIVPIRGDYIRARHAVPLRRRKMENPDAEVLWLWL